MTEEPESEAAPQKQPPAPHDPLAPQQPSTPIGEQPTWFLDPRRDQDPDWIPAHTPAEGQGIADTDGQRIPVWPHGEGPSLQATPSKPPPPKAFPLGTKRFGIALGVLIGTITWFAVLFALFAPASFELLWLCPVPPLAALIALIVRRSRYALPAYIVAILIVGSAWFGTCALAVTAVMSLA